VRRRSILVVDDEISNLAVLEEHLLDDYDVVSAISGVEAMQFIQRREFDIIIADQVMPEMTGTQLLEQARKIVPDTMRMILTAHSDEHAMLEAINKGQVYRFLKKPWNRTELSVMVRQALEVRDALLANRRLLDELKAKNAQLENTLERLQQTQDQLLRNAKMSTVGQLTTGVVNQMRRHRRTVQTVLDLSQTTNLPAEIADQLMKVADEMTAVFHAVDLLRGFSKEENWTLRRTWCNFDDLADAAIQFAELDELFADCDLTVAHGSPAMCFVDFDKVKQVVIHLLRNAAQASAPSGHITVMTSSVQGGAAISVTDDGPGIPDEEVDRVWEPFYTTREDQNLGLGLQISRMVAEAHGGTIELESTPGVGTTATIVLPIEPPGAQ